MKDRILHPGIFKTTTSKAGVILLLALAIILISGMVFDQYQPEQTTSAVGKAPSMSHLFGTDWLGHDLYSQIAWGSIPSLFVAVTGALGSVIIGLLVGTFTGYFRRLNAPLSAASDIIMVFPVIPLLILVGSLYVATDLFIAELLVLVMWPVVARVIRAQVAAIKKMPYIDAARLGGSGNLRIVFSIIIPEVGAIAIAYFIINVSLAVVITTALEFLGVGNPDVASWGSILYWAQNYAFLNGWWWWIAIPGAFITLIATGFALIGFSIEEIINPRLRSAS